MSAGSTQGGGFPPDSKPKCLFHYDGEVILEMQVRVLREAGINDITVVAGYKIDLVQRFNKDNQLGVNVLYNPTAASDKIGSRGWVKGIETAKIGVRSADDDVLLIFGDVLLTLEGIKKVVEDENRCASVYSGSGYQLYKIPKALIPDLIKYSGPGGGMMALHQFCVDNNGIRLVLGIGSVSDAWRSTCKTKIVQLAAAMHDIDYFYQTDEGKG